MRKATDYLQVSLNLGGAKKDAKGRTEASEASIGPSLEIRRCPRGRPRGPVTNPPERTHSIPREVSRTAPPSKLAT